MVRAVALLVDREGAPVELLGVGELVLTAAEAGDLVQALRELGVGRRERLLPDGEPAPGDRLRVGEAALIAVEDGQRLERAEQRGTFGPVRLLADRERAAVERLRLRVLALALVEVREGVEARRDVRGLVAERVLLDCEDPPGGGLGVGGLVLLRRGRGQGGEARR